MKNARRDVLKAGTAGAVAVGAATLGLPMTGLAQPKPIRIGVLHPVTGPLAYSGQQCREGAMMAIDAINKAGGIKSLGGAKIEPVIGDAQSKPAVGAAEIEKMHQDGVSAVIGAYASAICFATTQAAAKYDLPHVVDIGVADGIMERGLKNTFRFGPGYKTCSETRGAEPAHPEHRSGQAGEDGDDHPRGVAVRHRHGQRAEGAAAADRLSRWSTSSSTPIRRATSTTSSCG